jgi:two-component system, cell cycle sensor histidine kinase and response regulator CckA
MSEHRWFETTFEQGPSGAVLLDRDGHVERSNRAFRDLLGAADDLAGKTLSELLGPASERLEAARVQALADGKVLSLSEFVLEPARRDRRHTVDVELYPQSDGRGQPTGVLMVVTDRTGPHRDAADSARLFYQAFLHSTNAMELTDRDGFLVDVNPAFERIYGYRKEEVVGRRPNVVASGRTDRDTYKRMWKDLLDPSIGSWSGEVINRDRTGVDHPVLLAITAIRAPDGAITHFLGVAVDLTERRAWERGAMHSERLVSLGQLAAGVAHEINTPLANIMLIAESIRRRSNDPWTQGRIDSVLQQTESAARIVRGLLDFARRPETRIGEVDLGELVARSVNFLKGKQSADVEVDLTVPKEPVFVRADREQINQVVTNLLNNAYDALDGHGRVEVEVGASAEWAHIRVSDDGPGIVPEVLTHLFEPFITTKPEGKGTGLGLAICHGIVQSHGGEIEVDSEPGQGTTFDVRLPRVPNGARTAAAPAPGN